MANQGLVHLALRIVSRTLEVAGLRYLQVPDPGAEPDRWTLQGDRTVVLASPGGARRAASIAFDAPRPTRAVVVVMLPELAASSAEARELRSRLVADAELGPALVADMLGEAAAP